MGYQMLLRKRQGLRMLVASLGLLHRHKPIFGDGVEGESDGECLMGGSVLEGQQKQEPRQQIC